MIPITFSSINPDDVVARHRHGNVISGNGRTAYPERTRNGGDDRHG